MLQPVPFNKASDVISAGSLVKLAMDADVDSARIRALIQSVGAYT